MLHVTLTIGGRGGGNRTVIQKNKNLTPVKSRRSCREPAVEEKKNDNIRFCDESILIKSSLQPQQTTNNNNNKQQRQQQPFITSGKKFSHPQRVNK